MKTSKMKSALIASILGIATVIGSVTPAMAGAPVLTVEKTDINKDLTRVNKTHERVLTLQSQLKGDRKAGLNTVALQKELRKAKADETQAKAYLRADKKDLLMDHQNYINEQRAELRHDRNTLVKTSFDVKKAKPEKSTALRKTRMEINDDKLALTQAKTTRNNDLLAANAKIEKVQGQNVAVLKTENAGAKLQNLAMK
ncbi:MAG: hypothetical protein JWO03_1474 [Bacteroidetes bacterium]|nr:hypothetical protein [Bacteroidota bacterium]